MLAGSIASQEFRGSRTCWELFSSTYGLLMWEVLTKPAVSKCHIVTPLNCRNSVWNHAWAETAVAEFTFLSAKQKSLFYVKCEDVSPCPRRRSSQTKETDGWTWSCRTPKHPINLIAAIHGAAQPNTPLHNSFPCSFSLLACVWITNSSNNRNRRRLPLVETKTDLLTSTEADERGEINKRENDLWRAGKSEDCQAGAAPPLALIYGRNITHSCCQRVNICLTAPYGT